MKTYWDNEGKFQKIYDCLYKEIPVKGPVPKEKGILLEALRAASNFYYDVYNDGAVNTVMDDEAGVSITNKLSPLWGLFGLQYFTGLSLSVVDLKYYYDLLEGNNEDKAKEFFNKNILVPLERAMDELILLANEEKQRLTGKACNNTGGNE